MPSGRRRGQHRTTSAISLEPSLALSIACGVVIASSKIRRGGRAREKLARRAPSVTRGAPVLAALRSSLCSQTPGLARRAFTGQCAPSGADLGGCADQGSQMRSLREPLTSWTCGIVQRRVLHALARTTTARTPSTTPEPFSGRPLRRPRFHWKSPSPVA